MSTQPETDESLVNAHTLALLDDAYRRQRDVVLILQRQRNMLNHNIEEALAHERETYKEMCMLDPKLLSPSAQKSRRPAEYKELCKGDIPEYE